MKRLSKILAILLAGTLIMVSCRSDNEDIKPDTPSTKYKYLLMTLSERVVGSKAGFVTAFDELPSGTVDNIDSNSLQGSNMGGFIAFGNHIYKKYATADNSNGIEKNGVDASGKVIVEGFLQTGQGKPGSGNFVILDESHGFYWDVDEPLKIQKFNPGTMARTGSLDMAAAVNERGKDEAGITFRSIGRKFLAVKNGKLFADLNYASTTGGQQGFWDDFYPDVYIVVIDIATGKYEKTIKVNDTGSISYVNENRMYNFDSNGDLYFITQGRSALGGKSKISRIKANSTDIDSTWELKFSDFNSDDKGKFTGIFLHDGLMIVNLNLEPLTGGPNGNINSKDVWAKYTVDINTKQFNRIKNVPVGRNEGAAESAVLIDDKIYVRAGTTAGDINGYFLYDKGTNSATQIFNVNVGGLVSGLYRIELP